MKSRSLHNSTKKCFLIFLTVTWQPFLKYHSPPSFPSRNITKNAVTHASPMRDIIIEQTLYQTIDWNVWGVVQQESNWNSKYFTALFSQRTSGRLLLLHILLFAESISAPNITVDLFFLFPLNIFIINNVDYLHVAISRVPRQLDNCDWIDILLIKKAIRQKCCWKSEAVAQ